jgi:two-component system, response regulator PdtaR
VIRISEKFNEMVDRSVCFARGSRLVNILIVEDDLFAAISMERDLIAAGHVVTGVASTRAQAKAMALAKRPSLALVDIRPNRSGDDVILAHELWAECNCVTLFVTTSISDAMGARGAGIGFIAKPYSTSVLVDCVKAVAQILTGQSVSILPSNFKGFWRPQFSN